MTPGEARDLATQEMSAPVISAASVQVDLTFDYDEMHPNVAAAIIARSDLGKTRYGQHLHTWNNRDPVTDLVQELVDALIYAQQDVQEHTVIYESSMAESAWRVDVGRDLDKAKYVRNTIEVLLEGLLA